MNSTKYGLDVNRLALWGCSAGGNLAAAVALRNSQPDIKPAQPRLSLVSLVVPATAHPRVHRTFEKQRQIPLGEYEEIFKDTPQPPQNMVEDFEKIMGKSEPVVRSHRTAMLTFPCAGYYSGDAHMKNPFVSMLLAKPSETHAPTHITVAACDELRSQGLAYAQVLRCSGVAVTEDVLAGVPHGFTFPLTARVTKSWLKRQVDVFEAAFI
jgi:acetyl esterase